MFRLLRPALCAQTRAATVPRYPAIRIVQRATMASLVDTVKSTLAQNIGGMAQTAGPTFTLDDVPDQTGKVAVITGASEGIGFGIAHTLLSKNISKIFSLSISKDVIDTSTKRITEELGADKASRMEWIQCDISDWHKIAQISTQISKSTDRLDILVNNAGRGFQTYQLTDYGVDRHLALNLFGHVVLTSHLLPLLKKTASENNTVRIVCLGSNLHEQSPKDTKFDSIDDINQDLGPSTQYARSKLTKLLYAKYLARHLTQEHPNILSNAVHPGIVDTKNSEADVHEPYPIIGVAMSVGMKPFKKDQFEGALSSLFAATVTTKSGEYICPPATPEKGSDLANDEQLGEQMMKLTREIVTQKTKADSIEKGCPMKDY